MGVAAAGGTFSILLTGTLYLQVGHLHPNHRTENQSRFKTNSTERRNVTNVPFPLQQFATSLLVKIHFTSSITTSTTTEMNVGLWLWYLWTLQDALCR